MISLLGATIAASSPWMLLSIPCALGLLVYIFRVRGSSQQTVVSSLLFLQELPRRPVGRKVFVPPLQFWLELAILTLLILAAAGLFLTRSGKHVAIVLDSSLSMGALYGAGGTRLEQAKRIAALDLNRGTPSTTYSVFSSESDLGPLSSSRESTSEALTALRSASQSHRADALQEHVTSLLSDPSYDAVWVYTDRELEKTPPTSRLIVNQLPVDPSTQTNAWIKGVQVKAEQDATTLSVAIGYSGSTTREALVEGECYTPNSQAAQKLASQTIKLTPGEHAHALFSPTSANWAYCRVHTRLQEASLFDSLPLDNEGWVAKPSSLLAVEVIGALTPQQLGLSSIPNISFTTPATTDKPSREYPTIYHRQVPLKIPTAPSLVVLPPDGPLPWGGATKSSSNQEAASKAREITRWDQSHPLLAYVNPSLVSFPEVHPLECPATATPILFSAAGPIACAGEQRNARYLITGFELFPFDGATNPTMSIFTLNIFKWLFQTSAASALNTLPSSLSLPETVQQAAYVQPNNLKLPLQAGSASANAPAIKGPGIVRLEHKDGTSEYLALNAYEDKESNLSLPTTLSFPTTSPLSSSTNRSASSLSLIYWLALAALIVIAADTLRRIVRRIRWSDA